MTEKERINSQFFVILIYMEDLISILRKNGLEDIKLKQLHTQVKYSIEEMEEYHLGPDFAEVFKLSKPSD